MIPFTRSTLAAALAAAFTSFAAAQTTTWIGASGGTWSTGTNWSGGTAPNSPAFSAIFNDGVTPGTVSMNNGTRQAGSITFENTSGTYLFTPGGVNGRASTLNLINAATTPAGNEISSALRNNRNSDGTGTINISGTGSAVLTVSGAIENQSAPRPTALDKTSTGVLVFSGAAANTYSSTTTVSAGRLELAKTAGLNAISGSTLTLSGGEVRLINANQIIDTANLVLGGGTFNANGLTETLGTLALSGSSFLDLGSAGSNSISFASSSALDWGSFELSISGSFVSGASVRFGNDATGLDSGQFDNISIAGFTGVGIDNDGWLTATSIPEPSAFTALAGLGALGLVASRRRR